ncbi:TetR/AcrR family transcriptional regulator [Glutamicibacter sp.]|uniref:TetR/AcrR family transcriptional regulator n=1 Tax=Glutamicibacter sp. TaxID=1931995 RepID=UPI0028BED7F8|nr:TetR/AcrR family transcriptional regulator [Glutamicibacter sp.]
MPQHPEQKVATRRRGQELVDAILQAAADELLEVGYAGLSYESVARRAGASKVSIYRRWSTKEELIRAAATQQVDIPQMPPEPSTLREDLLLVFRGMAQQIQQPAGQLVRSLLAASLAQQAPSMAEMSWGMGPNMMRVVVERAVERGELHQIPPQLVLSAPVDLLKQRLISYREVDEQYIEQLVDQIAVPLWKAQDTR